MEVAGRSDMDRRGIDQLHHDCQWNRSLSRGGIIKDIAGQGRAVFSAVGNGEQLGEVMAPSGVPEAYQVGGVDQEGHP